MKWKNRLCWLVGIVTAVALLVTQAYATSSRVTPEPGYAAHDYTIKTDYPDYDWYSGGLDVGYAKVAKFYNPENPNNENSLARVFVHQNLFFNGDTKESWVEINLYASTGEYVTTLANLGGAWPQSVKIIGNKVWFSYTYDSTTGGSGAGLFSVPWYPDDLSQYPITPQLEVPDIPYNWEVEQRAVDGKIFFCGLAGDSWDPPPPDPHSVYYIDQENSNNVIKVLEIGGYSSGFAFDSEGNLWSGEYLLEWNSTNSTMHIDPCRLGMWTKADVDAVIAGQRGPLTWDDAAVVIPLGTKPGTDLNWGPNDVEADGNGNIYVSLNTYEQFDENHEYGAVIKVYKDGEEYHTQYITNTDCTGNNNWDWHRSLAFDGNADIDAGGYTDPTQLPSITGNRLYLDMDHNQKDPNSPDQIVGITTDQDFDADGVPDSLDNAPETYNPEQVDTDGDMYGNVCDADFDNDGYVGIQDFNIFSSNYNQTVPPGNPDVDMDGGDYIGPSDFAEFQSRYNSSAPWF